MLCVYVQLCVLKMAYIFKSDTGSNEANKFVLKYSIK